MKYFVITLLILSVTISAFADLTTTDLEKIEKIVEKSETRMKEYVNIKIESIDKRITDTRNSSYALIGLISVVIGIPLWRTEKTTVTSKNR